jgi:hypothetical protein
MATAKTGSMHQSPSWDRSSQSESQEIPHLIWDPLVPVRVQKSKLLESVLSHMEQIHAPYVFKTYYNIVTWRLKSRIV